MNDLSGNIISIGDNVFITKAFIETHYAHSSNDFDEYPDIVNEELEAVRKDYLDKGYDNNFTIESLLEESNKDIEPYLLDNRTPNEKRKIVKNQNIEEAQDYTTFSKNEKVEIQPSVSQISNNTNGFNTQLPIGRILFIEPNKQEKLQQLKESIKLIYQAEDSGESEVTINDYLYSGAITQENFNSEILKRSKEITNINTTYQRTEQKGSKVYLQVEDYNHKNGKLISELESIIQYIHNTINNEVKILNISNQLILNKAELLRDKLPNFLGDYSSKDIFELYPASITTFFIQYNQNKKEYAFDEETKELYSLLKQGVDKLKSQKPDLDITDKILDYLISKIIVYKPYLELVINKLSYNDLRFMLKYNNKPKTLSTSDLSQRYKNTIILSNTSQKQEYIKLLQYIISCLKYSDGYKSYAIDDISKVAFDNSDIKNTVNRIALNIEQWFICNEGKLLKSILG